MKNFQLRGQRIAILACCSILMLASACIRLPSFGEPAQAEIAWRQLDWERIDRTYGVYVPEEVRNPASLVFLLHGGGGSALKTWNQEHGRSWKALADTHGFVLVLPEGISDAEDKAAHHWNDCRICAEGAATATSADDVGFIMHLIATVGTWTPIDAERVYVTGASNGGMMTFRLAIEAGESFAAAAAIIANLPVPSECLAEPEPIPMLIMNGTEDPLIPFEGGCVAGARCKRGRVMSTADTVSYWIAVNDASTEATVAKLPNRAWFDGSRVTIYRFDGRAGGADVVYYHVQGGGHTVPGYEREPAASVAITGPKNRDISGPEEIWAFFSAQP